MVFDKHVAKFLQWLLRHSITVFSCVLIILLGATVLTHAAPTTIGEDVSTTNLTVTGDLEAKVGRTATFVVAASDSSAASKTQADYVCDGTSDQVEIQAALDALPSYGGKVLLMEGNYYFTKATDRGTAKGSIYIDKSNVILEGSGTATRLMLADNQNCSVIRIYGNGIKNITVRDLYINGNMANQSHDANFDVCGVKAKYDHSKTSIQSVTVEGCFIEDCYDLNVQLFGNGAKITNNRFGNVDRDVAELLYADGGEISHNYTYLTSGCSDGLGLDACNNAKIINNTTIVSAGPGTLDAVHRTWASNKNILIEGNHILFESGCIVTDFAIKAMSRSTIINANICESLDSSYKATIAILAGNCVVTNNYLYNGFILLRNTADSLFSKISNNTFECAGRILIDAGYADIYDNQDTISSTWGWNVPDIRTKLFKNVSGGTLLAGMVVVMSTADFDGIRCTTTTTQGDDRVLGMVYPASITNNYFGRVLLTGKTTLLKVNGTADIAIGDFLCTYSEAGISQKAGAGDMAFAIAMEAYAVDDSNGVIDALIIHPRKL